MPTTGLTFRGGAGSVRCEPSGWVRTVVHEHAPGLSYLAGATVTGLRADGVLLDPREPEVLADVDEVEFVHTYPDRLRVAVRHTFASGWGLRVAFASLAPEVQSIESAELRLEPAPGCVAWALALGVTAAYAVSPTVGGPVLGGVLRLGSVERASNHGLQLTPFELRPGARYVLQLNWDWYRTPSSFGQTCLSEAPSAMFVTSGESVQVRVNDDVAVVAPGGVQTTRREDHLELVSDAPGTFPFELRSARGTTAFNVSWVDPVSEVLAGSAAGALAGPRTAARVVRLAGVAEALVVQYGLVLGVVDDPDEAAEALDLFTARLDRTRQLTPFEVAYLCRELDRTGDLDLLDDATDAVLAQARPAPGLGMAATQLCLGLLVAGRQVEPVLRHLAGLARRLHGTASAPEISGLSAQAAALELLAVTHPGPGVVRADLPDADLSDPDLPDPDVPDGDVRQRIAALGLHLGAGLVAQAVAPVSTDELSHLIAVFQLLPEPLSASMSQQWGCSAHALAQRATPELLARLGQGRTSDAHAWLVLALQTS